MAAVLCLHSWWRQYNEEAVADTVRLAVNKKCHCWKSWTLCFLLLDLIIYLVCNYNCIALSQQNKIRRTRFRWDPSNTRQYPATTDDIRQYPEKSGNTQQHPTIPGSTQKNPAITGNTRQWRKYPATPKNTQQCPAISRNFCDLNYKCS